MIPRDTTLESHEAQLRAYRRLGAPGCARLAARLSSDMRELTRAGIRSRHRNYTDEEVELALRRIPAGRRPFSPRVAGRSATRALSDEGAGAFLICLTAKLAAAGVPNMVVGSFASSFHGIPRSSQNLDLVIDPQPESLRQFLAELPPADYYVDADAALEWAKLGGGSQLQLRDVSGILQLRGNELDFAYIERWVTELGLGDLLRQVRGDAPSPA